MESFKRENVLVRKWESRRRSKHPEGEIILRLPERKFKVILDSGLMLNLVEYKKYTGCEFMVSKPA